MEAVKRYLLPGALFAFVFLIPRNPALMQYQGRNVLLALSFLIAAKIGTKFRSLPLALALAYFFSHSVLTWAGFFYRPGWAELTAAQSFGYFAAIVLGVSLLHERESSRFVSCAGALCLVSSAVMVGKKLLGQDPYFFLNNAAADACLVAVLFPIVLRRLLLRESLRPWARRGLNSCFMALPIAAVAVSGSSTGLVALTLGVTVYGLIRSRSLYAIFGAIPCALLAGAGLYFFSPDIPFADSGRVKVWRDSFAFFSRTMDPGAIELYRSNVDPRVLWYLDLEASQAFGFGSGSYLHLSTGIQLANGQFAGSIFPFMHNDWLEILFNEGYVGLFLALLAGLHALLRALDRPEIFAALLTYGAIMLVQFPLRYAGAGFLGALLCAEAFSLRGENFAGIMGNLNRYCKIFRKRKFSV